MTGTTPGRSERFPGFDVVGRSSHWDAVTAGVVLSRLSPPPPLRFFTIEEEATARPLLDRLLAQDDDPKVPVFELIDARLAEGEIDGWRYDDMPEDGDAFRIAMRYINEDSQQRFGIDFADASRAQQNELLEAVRIADDWHGLPATRVWSLWMRYACTAFYSHPWAWNEMGFGGPAYPTGYKNLGVDGLEPWEVRDRGERR
jgi:hypothetical protein